MKRKLSSTAANADVERVWAPAISNEQLNNVIHTSLLESEPENYGNKAEVMKKVDRKLIRGLIAEETFRLFAKRIEAGVQTHSREPSSTCHYSATMFPSNGVKMASARSLETVLIELFSRESAEDVIPESLGRWSKPAELMNSILAGTVFSAMLIQLLAMFSQI